LLSLFTINRPIPPIISYNYIPFYNKYISMFDYHDDNAQEYEAE